MSNQSFEDGKEGRINTGGDSYSYELGKQERENNQRESFSGFGSDDNSSDNGKPSLGLGLFICLGAVAAALEVILIALISAAITAFFFSIFLKQTIKIKKSYKYLIITNAIPFFISAIILWQKINSQLSSYKMNMVFWRFEEEIPPVQIKALHLLPSLIISAIITGLYIFYLNRKTDYFKGLKGFLKSTFVIAPILLFVMFLIISLIDVHTIFSFHERIPIRISL
ncbi:MAG: hypothetical protein NTW29_12575 [Bacteroidetes bacterium]|nr:hypothetical protein [Bacteroidota bacterium]